jgi:hypothetical protein
MDGPISVALLLYDVAGNPAPRVGLRHFTKNYTCPVPPPICIPGQDQVTLFDDPYFQGGCVKYDMGNYPTGNSLNPLGNNDADSILVGDDVIASLYSEENYNGHSQALLTDTAYIHYEWVSGNTLSSMKVSSRNSVPQVSVPINPTASAVFREGDVIPFSWLNGGGATEYQVEIYLGLNIYKNLPWQTDPVQYGVSFQHLRSSHRLYIHLWKLFHIVIPWKILRQIGQEMVSGIIYISQECLTVGHIAGGTKIAWVVMTMTNQTQVL